jgi:hypothetical protein
VTVTNVATGAPRSVMTNNEGIYNFPSLLPATISYLKCNRSRVSTSRWRSARSARL